MLAPLDRSASQAEQQQQYEEVRVRLGALLEGEDDWVAAMATVCSELHHAFAWFDWTGFYRAVSDDLLIIGPYQGGHGCLRIPFSQGVCGAAATHRQTQRVADVHAFDGHIACSTRTQSEIVVPVITPDDVLLAVLDIDSDTPDAFNPLDQMQLEALAADLGRRFANTAIRS